MMRGISCQSANIQYDSSSIAIPNNGNAYARPQRISFRETGILTSSHMSEPIFTDTDATQ